MFFAGVLWKDHIWSFNRKLALRSAKRTIKSYEGEQEILERGRKDKNREFRGYFLIVMMSLSMIMIQITLLAAYVIFELNNSWYAAVLLFCAIWGVTFPWVGMKMGFGYADPESIDKLQVKIDKVRNKYTESSNTEEVDGK